MQTFVIKTFLKSPRGYVTLSRNEQKKLRALIKRLERPEAKKVLPRDPTKLSKVHVDELQTAYYRDLDPRIKLKLLTANNDTSDAGGTNSDRNANRRIP